MINKVDSLLCSTVCGVEKVKCFIIYFDCDKNDDFHIWPTVNSVEELKCFIFIRIKKVDSHLWSTVCGVEEVKCFIYLFLL
jgi:hypothetical protein